MRRARWRRHLRSRAKWVYRSPCALRVGRARGARLDARLAALTVDSKLGSVPRVADAHALAVGTRVHVGAALLAAGHSGHAKLLRTTRLGGGALASSAAPAAPAATTASSTEAGATDAQSNTRT